MKSKIENLNKYFKLLFPTKNTSNHIISFEIDKLIDVCKKEVRLYNFKCVQLYKKIEEYKNKLIGTADVNEDNDIITETEYKEETNDKPNSKFKYNYIEDTDKNKIQNYTNESGLEGANYTKIDDTNHTKIDDTKYAKIDDTKFQFRDDINQIELEDTNNACLEEEIQQIKKKFKIDNIVMLFYYLNAEETRLFIKMTQFKLKAKRLYESIIVMKNFINDNSALDFDIDMIDAEMFSRLKILNENYKAKVLEMEKQRNKTYKKILLLYKELEIEEKDATDKAIIDDYTSVDINKLIDKHTLLLKLKEDRQNQVKTLIEDIKTLQTMLKDFYSAHYILEPDIGTSNIIDLQSIQLNLQNKYQMYFDNIFTEKTSQLTALCQIFNIKMSEFKKTPENIEIMSNIINELNMKKISYVNIIELKKKHDDLKQRMIEFEKNASDPKRLFRSSFQLMSEEKFRKNAYPSLLNLEKKMLDMIDEYEISFGMFEYEGECLKKRLVAEIENRIINRNVFIMNRNEAPKKK